MADELYPHYAAYYQTLIGILRQMVKLGRVDITCEVSIMSSSHLALPCEGHLEQLFYTFTYLKKCHNMEMLFDPSDPNIDMIKFLDEVWSNSGHGKVEEEVLGNALAN